MSRAARVAVRCPGKVNLHLEVLGRRPDGFHELRTLFAAVGVWDDLELAVAPSGVLDLTVSPEGVVSTGADNLVVRAAQAAAAAWGVGTGVRITLLKRIPIGGGLGGGSADAAATLVALAALWQRPQTPASLASLAAGLGSDVPFFLVAGAAWGAGRGTVLEAVPDLPPWWLVLLPGEEPVSTAEVYSSLGLGPVGVVSASAVYDEIAAGGELRLSACRNDLEAKVAARWPGVADRLAALRATKPLLAMLSGSGGTAFAVYPDEERALGEAGRLSTFRPLVAPLLSRERSLLRPFVVEES